MSIESQNSYEYFQHRSIRLLKNSCGKLVSIPTGTDLEGFLAEDRERKNNYTQVRFLTTEDEGIKTAFNKVWQSFIKVKESDICPEIQAITEHDGLPCCISSLPQGEPVNHFINRNGDLPPEVAVRLILEFVKALRNHNPAFFQSFAISPESIWISRTSNQPKIVLGEISPVRHNDPEAHNVTLCVNLLKYVTGNPENDPLFQVLLKQIAAGQETLAFLEDTLNCFAEANPAANYWMGFNDPASLLERIISAEAANRLKGRTEDSIIVKTAKKTFWPSVVAATVTVVGFIAYALITLANDPDLKIADFQRLDRPSYLGPVRAQVNPAPVRKPSPVRSRPVVISAPAPPVTSPTQLAPRRAPRMSPTPGPRVVPPAPVAVAKNESPLRQFLVEPKVTPLLKALLADTGDLFKDLLNQNETSEWLIKEEPVKNESRSGFTAEDEKTLTLLGLKKAAADARANNQPFEAIRNEVALLKLEPNSIDARIRLHDHLNQVRELNFENNKITAEEIRILVEASTENSTAQDILDRHYQKNGDWLF